MSQLVKHLLSLSPQPDNILLIEGDTRWTKGQLTEKVDRLCQWLSTQSLTRGDRVACWMGNQKEMLIAILACRKTGLVPVPINTQWSLDDTAYVLKHSGAKLILTSQRFEEQLQPVSQALSLPLSTVEGILTNDTPLPEYSLDEGQTTADELSQLGLLIYTSGTTAKPKGVMLSDHNLLANMEGIAATGILGNGEETLLMALPLFHAYGLTLTLYAISANVPLVLEPTFNPKVLLATIAKEQVSILPLVPTMLRVLGEAIQKQESRHALQSIKWCISGGAALPPALLEQLANAGLPVLEGYGLTETSPVIAVNRPNKDPKPGTVGNILPNVNVRIQPLDVVQASSSASDTPGEIEVKGHSVMLGYYQDKEATKAVMTEDGWLKTGDIGKINSDGTLSLTDGRLKDLIIKHGENIAPQRIEAALSAHPDIGDISVFGIPDNKSGEQIIAYISPNESVVSADGLSEELMAWCREHLPPLWQPKRIIVKDELPKNATGKILKRQLKEDYLSSSLPV